MIILYIAAGIIIPVSVIAGIVFMIIKLVKGDAKGLQAKEIGIEVGMFIALFFSIISIVQIIFSAIDKKFVDVLSDNNMNTLVSSASDDIRWAVSITAVAFPVYLVLAWVRAAHLRKNRDRRDVPALKYSQYFVLFLSALFIIGTLITTIYEYMGGGVGTAFLLKALTTIVMSAVLSIYNYYLIKRNYDENSKSPIVFTVLSLIVVATLIVYSVNIIGSPAEIRKMRFDEKRLTNLSNIQNEILNSWMRTKKLPNSLAELNTGNISGYNFIAPTDPVTKSAYTYKVLENSKNVKATGQDCRNYYPSKYTTTDGVTCEVPTPAKFELCANFDTERNFDENGNNLTARNTASIYQSEKYYDVSMGGGYYGGEYDKSPTWNHGVGQTCFTRTIDPVRYPVY